MRFQYDLSVSVFSRPDRVSHMTHWAEVEARGCLYIMLEATWVESVPQSSHIGNLDCSAAVSGGGASREEVMSLRGMSLSGD